MLLGPGVLVRLSDHFEPLKKVLLDEVASEHSKEELGEPIRLDPLNRLARLLLAAKSGYKVQVLYFLFDFITREAGGLDGVL